MNSLPVTRGGRPRKYLNFLALHFYSIFLLDYNSILLHLGTGLERKQNGFFECVSN